MKLDDLTGVQFENLVVLYRADDVIKDGKKRRVKWHCRCNCGNEFDVISDNLKRRPSMTCKECANKRRSENNRMHVVGNKYGRLTILEVIPGTRPTKVKCQCDCGNEHVCSQSDIVTRHTQSCGCLQKERVSESNVKDWTGVVSAYGVELISQSHVNNKGQWLWNCKCGVCGKLFVELPAKINNGHVTSCGCAIMSSGERFVEDVLKDINVDFKNQYSFPDCKYKNRLHFDFAVFSNSELLYLIEYDGEQHYKLVDWFGGTKGFEESKLRDEIKNQYCVDHNIPLLRIPYSFSNEEIKRTIYEYHLSVTTAGCA